MRLKILLNTPSSLAENYVKMFDEFRDEIELHILTQTSLVQWYAAHSNVVKIHDIIADYSMNKSSKTVVEYRIPDELPLYEYVEYDRFLSRRPYDEIMSVARHHCQYIHNLLETEQFDSVIGEIGGFIHSLLFWYGEQLKTPFIWPMMSFWNDRFFLTSGGPTALQDNIQNIYQNRHQIALPEQAIADARSYVESFAKESPLMIHVQDHFANRNASIAKASRFFVRTPIKVLKLLRGIFVRPEIYLDRDIYWKLRYEYLNKLNYALYKNTIFDDILPSNEKNVLFYLHYEPDLSTYVWSPYYKNQAEVITNIAFSLPNGYRLYVKEHPLSLGLRPIGFYTHLKNIPQVRLLSSVLPTKQLLHATDLVITITGTIGWEALFYHKPVITLGNVFYNAFKGVINITDWSLLRASIKQCLNNINYSKDEVVEFVALVMNSCVQGDYYKTITDPGNHSNNKKIAEVILENIKRLKETNGLL